MNNIVNLAMCLPSFAKQPFADYRRVNWGLVVNGVRYPVLWLRTGPRAVEVTIIGHAFRTRFCLV